MNAPSLYASVQATLPELAKEQARGNAAEALEMSSRTAEKLSRPCRRFAVQNGRRVLLDAIQEAHSTEI